MSEERFGKLLQQNYKMLYINLIQQYKDQQQKLKTYKQKLVNESDRLSDKIQRQLDKLKQISSIITQGSKLQTKVYNQSLNSQNCSNQVISITILSNYLKMEKYYLSQLAQQNNRENHTQLSGKQLLHKLSNKKKLQNYLDTLEIVKIESQIEFIQKNILLNQNKARSTIVYEDVEGMTVKQQKQLNERISLALQQLQRVVYLSNQCGGNQNIELNSKIQLLNDQSQRLQNITKNLQKQSRQIVQVKQFFKNYQPKEIINFVNYKSDQIKQQAIHIKQDKRNNSNQEYPYQNRQNFDFLINFNPSLVGAKTTVFNKPFQQVYHLVKSNKNKIKKIKN